MDVRIDRNTMVAMRDGVRLATDIYLPTGAGPFPTLLLRLPHCKEIAQSSNYAHPIWYARRGFAVVVQDTRGRYSSEGEFYPMRYEADDSDATLDWLAGQKFCNGQIGMYGCSYAGKNQILIAARRPRHLTTICPAVYATTMYDSAYTSGAFNLGLQLWRGLQQAADTSGRRGDQSGERELRDMAADAPNWFPFRPLSALPALRKVGTGDHYFDYLDHPQYDSFWSEIEQGISVEDIEVPALHISGWYDIFVSLSLRCYTRLRRLGKAHQHLLVGPWYHTPWTQTAGDTDFGTEARSPIDEIQVRWFHHWLGDQSKNKLDLPAVRIFIMGENRWRNEDEWPLTRAVHTRYYLHSRGRANSLEGDGGLSLEPPGSENSDVFVYDPSRPVNSIGGNSCCDALLTPMGSYDQTPVERRRDVLVYSSEVLEHPVEVTGHVEAAIFAASTARDTDWTVKLVDVHPDGRALNLCNGIVRARYREGLDQKPRLLEPSRPYEFKIDVGVTANLFLPGHRIRVEISSSNFPHYDAHPNIGGVVANATQSDLITALQEVLHDAGHPSHITLPVIPR